jgi:hypothetical protein
VIDILTAAAEAARRASDDLQFVEIVVTEEGFIVRGERRVGERRARATLDVSWAEFGANTALLGNAVYLVDTSLRRKQ